jgi:hypothetical protein
MALYVSLSDCTKAPPGLSEEELEAADIYVNSVLFGLGVDPATVTLPNATLASIAKNYAYYLAANNAIKDQDSGMVTVRDGYMAQVKMLVGSLSRAALGLTPGGGTGGGYGSITIGRG